MRTIFLALVLIFSLALNEIESAENPEKGKGSSRGRGKGSRGARGAREALARARGIVIGGPRNRNEEEAGQPQYKPKRQVAKFTLVVPEEDSPPHDSTQALMDEISRSTQALNLEPITTSRENYDMLPANFHQRIQGWATTKLPTRGNRGQRSGRSSGRSTQGTFHGNLNPLDHAIGRFPPPPPSHYGESSTSHYAGNFDPQGASSSGAHLAYNPQGASSSGAHLAYNPQGASSSGGHIAYDPQTGVYYDTRHQNWVMPQQASHPAVFQNPQNQGQSQPQGGNQLFVDMQMALWRAQLQQQPQQVLHDPPGQPWLHQHHQQQVYLDQGGMDWLTQHYERGPNGETPEELAWLLQSGQQHQHEQEQQQQQEQQHEGNQGQQNENAQQFRVRNLNDYDSDESKTMSGRSNPRYKHRRGGQRE